MLQIVYDCFSEATLAILSYSKHSWLFQGLYKYHLKNLGQFFLEFCTINLLSVKWIKIPPKIVRQELY